MYNPGQSITPDQAMRFAIETAKMGRGFVSPNPLVGCVIVDKEHKFVSSGAHRRYGSAHAEANALRAVKDPGLLQGATLYVTLEPCSHHGSTPPCAEAIVKTPIKKVVYGVKDPNPLVAGKGLALLKENGKVVEHFQKYEEACQEVAEQFFHHIKKSRPFIALKVGTSLDGKIALKTGESQWITSEEARIHSRQTRAHYDATMIGSGTLYYDNPTLDFRGTGFEGQKHNRIVILDPKGRGAESFKESNIYKTHGPKNIVVLTRPEHIDVWAKSLVPVVQWEGTREGWKQALKNLHQKGIYSLYAEGGSYVFGQLLTYGLAQKLYLYQSAKILGDGISWTKYFYNEKLANVPELKNWSAHSVGPDRLNIAYF